jgi:hypothetical protein
MSGWVSTSREVHVRAKRSKSNVSNVHVVMKSWYFHRLRNVQAGAWGWNNVYRWQKLNLVREFENKDTAPALEC